MDPVTNSRNAFILGLSLSELAFLYFMLLLLISLFMMKDHEIKIKDKDNKIEKQVLQIFKDTRTIENQKTVIEGLQRADFDHKTWLVDINNLEEKNYILKDKNKKLKKQLTEVRKDDSSEKLTKVYEKLDLKGLDDHELETKLNELLGINEQNIKLTEENITLSKKFKKAAISLKDGWDTYPCFYYIDETYEQPERPKYIYDIEIYDNKYIVEPIWINEWQKDSGSSPKIYLTKEEKIKYSRNISGVPKTKSKVVMNINEFMDFGKMHYDDGKKTENNCHHNVRVWDYTSNNKMFWKKNFGILENYFYKQLMDRELK